MRRLAVRGLALRWLALRGLALRGPGAAAVRLRELGVRRLLMVALQFAAVAYLTAVASLLFWSHAPELIGWHPRVVLTGSMMPVIQPGDVSVIGPAVVGPSTLPRGRIVLVRDPEMRSGFYLHRVVRYDSAGRIITKGDANRTEDSAPVLAVQITGQLRLVIPIVGRPVVWLQNDDYLPVVLVGLGTWASLAVVAGTGVNRSQSRAGRRRGRPDLLRVATPGVAAPGVATSGAPPASSA